MATFADITFAIDQIDISFVCMQQAAADVHTLMQGGTLVLYIMPCKQHIYKMVLNNMLSNCYRVRHVFTH